MLCPCGSSLSFKACCQAFITPNNSVPQFPETPEQLMRSRFSAYAIKNGQYIFDTYGCFQQQSLNEAELQSWADECQWIALKIHNAVGETVEFSAYYIVNNMLCELREKSNFKRENSFWRYIDGDIKLNKEIVQVKQNNLCPCNDYDTSWSVKKNKKFKHCCGKK